MLLIVRWRQNVFQKGCWAAISANRYIVSASQWHFLSHIIEAVNLSELSLWQSGRTHTLFRPWRGIQRPAPLPAPCVPTRTIEQQIRSKDRSLGLLSLQWAMIPWPGSRNNVRKPPAHEGVVGFKTPSIANINRTFKWMCVVFLSFNFLHQFFEIYIISTFKAEHLETTLLELN